MMAPIVIFNACQDKTGNQFARILPAPGDGSAGLNIFVTETGKNFAIPAGKGPLAVPGFSQPRVQRI